MGGPGSMCFFCVRIAHTAARRLDLVHVMMVLPLLSVCASRMSSMCYHHVFPPVQRDADKSVELSVHHQTIQRQRSGYFSCFESSARGGLPRERSTTRRHRHRTDRYKEVRQGKARASFQLPVLGHRDHCPQRRTVCLLVKSACWGTTSNLPLASVRIFAMLHECSFCGAAARRSTGKKNASAAQGGQEWALCRRTREGTRR